MRRFLKYYELARPLILKGERRAFIKRVKLAFRLACIYPELHPTLEYFFSETLMRRKLIAVPGVMSELYKQQTHVSFYKGSKASERICYLKTHFSLLEKIYKDECALALYTEAITPFTYQLNNTELSVNVVYHRDVAREGFLWLIIKIDDVVIYKITFWLAETEGVRRLYMSTFQGGKKTLDINRAFTKTYYGIRPQNMAIAALRCYARNLDVSELYTLPGERFLSDDIKDLGAIEAFIQEQGGELIEEGLFVRLALNLPRKPLEDIPARKRSMYKKRYEFLDDLEQQLGGYFRSHLK